MRGHLPSQGATPETQPRAAPPRAARRLWSETASEDELLDPSLSRYLERHDIELLVAVRPWNAADMGRSAARLRDRGVRVGLWPMLDDPGGRWGSAWNIHEYTAFAASLLHHAPDTLAIDLEPPFGLSSAIVSDEGTLRGALAWFGRRATEQATTAAIRALVDRARSVNIRVTAAIAPTIGPDPIRRGVEWLLGTPTRGAHIDAPSAMLYTSLICGWSRGMVTAAWARRLLRKVAIDGTRHFGPGFGVSVGVVSPGAFGDEPAYPSLDDLKEDLRALRGCGIGHVALFDLGGTLRRGGYERWLDVFVEETSRI